jgi:hypothetical protein
VYTSNGGESDLKGKVFTVRNPNIRNDVGGTTRLAGIFHATVTKYWNDYETGYCFIGKLKDEAEIDYSRKSGYTGTDLEVYKQYPKNPSLYANAVKARKEYSPETVYFSQFDIM